MSANCSMSSISGPDKERHASQGELATMRVNILPNRARKSDKSARSLSKWAENRAALGSSPELSSPTMDKDDPFNVVFSTASRPIDPRQQLRQDIARYLANDHIEILEAIIAGNFTTEGLAHVAPCILDLVKMYSSSEATLQFIQNVLGHRVAVYYGDTPNPPDMTSLKNVLRDNSLPALLLSTYVRSELQSFIVQVLRPVILESLTLLSECESGVNAPTTSHQDENLRQVTVAIISSLIQHSGLIPTHIRRLLTFLHAKVESSIALLRKTHRLSSPTTAAPPSPTSTTAAALPLPRSRESSSRSTKQSIPCGTGTCSSGAAEAEAATVPMKPDPPPSRSSSTSPRRANQPPTPLVISPDTPPVLPSPVFGMSPLVEGSFSGSFSTQTASMATSHPSPGLQKDPHHHQQEQAHGDKAAGGRKSQLLSINTSLVHGGLSSITSSLPQAAAASEDAAKGCPQSPTKVDSSPSTGDASDVSSSPGSQDEGAAAMRRRALKRTNAVNRRSQQMQYSLADQVVATFVFLRVLVPTLTLPDRSGILEPGACTREVQRGLVLMGKLLMSVVNDTDSKPGSVSGAQLQFLQEQRKRVKLFVGSLLGTSETASNPSSPDTHGAPLLDQHARGPFMAKASPKKGPSSASPPLGAPHGCDTLPPRPKTADTSTVASRKGRPPSASVSESTSQATDSATSRGATSRKTPTLRSLFRVGPGASLRKRNDYRSMPSLMSPVDGSLGGSSGGLQGGGSSGGGSGGDVSHLKTSPPPKNPSRENSELSLGPESRVHPQVPEIPTDTFISQLDKGMDKVEVWVLEQVEAEAVPPSLVITLLQLRSLIQQFLAMPKPNAMTSCPETADGDGDEQGDTSPRSAKSTAGGNGASGVSFLKNLGRKLLSNKNQRSLEFTGSSLSGGASGSNVSTGAFSEFMQSPVSSSRASSEGGIAGSGGKGAEPKSRSHNASTDMHPASVDASGNTVGESGAMQPPGRRRSRFLPRPLSVPGGLLLSTASGSVQSSGAGSGVGPTPP